MSATDWISAGAAVAAVAAAGASWRAAEKSNQVANELAGIEKARRHTELTPEFAIHFVARTPGSRTASLYIELTGPSGLDRLDSVVVTFRTDGMAREEVDNVYGPVRFERGIDGAPDRTSSAPFSIERGETRILHVEQTKPHGEGWTPFVWSEEFHAQPVRLRLDCTKEGLAGWFVTIDLEGPDFEGKNQDKVFIT